jgi:hypothetical protein
MTRACFPIVCNECGDDIWPGDEIMRAIYRVSKYGIMNYFTVILCADCGTLYRESQEYGSDAEETESEQSPSSS